MARGYADPVVAAAIAAGRSIQRGYERVGAAHVSAADFALQQAKGDLEIEQFQRDAPIREAKRIEAREKISEAEFLDQPVRVSEGLFGAIFGKNPKPHEMAHIVGNDIPGAILDTIGATYDPKTDTITGPGGKPLTRRNLARYSPLISGVIAAKSAPEKMFMDQMDFLEAKKNKTPEEKAQLAKMKKLKDNPEMYARSMLKAYNRHDAALADIQGRILTIGGNTKVIDDAMQRNERIKGEFMDMIKAEKLLQKANLTLKPGITQKDIANLSAAVMKNVDAKMKDLQFEGAFEDFQGTGIPFTQEQIQMYRDKLIQDDIRTALENANAVMNRYVTPTVKVTGSTKKVKGEDKKDRAAEAARMQQTIEEGRAKKKQRDKEEAEMIKKRDEALERGKRWTRQGSRAASPRMEAIRKAMEGRRK